MSSHGYTLCATVVVRVGVRSELAIGYALAPSRHLGGCLKVPSGDVSSHGYTLCATVVVRVGVRSELGSGTSLLLAGICEAVSESTCRSNQRLSQVSA